MKAINRLLAASSGQNIHAVGTYIWLKTATGAVQIKTDRGETAVLEAGDFVRTDHPFTEFFVTDLSGSQNDLTFNTSQNGEAGKYGNLTLQSPNGFAGKADLTIPLTATTLLLAANSQRSEAIITAFSTNTADTRIGGSGAGAANGIPLVAGASVFLNTTSAIYGYCAAAASFNLAETTY